MVLKLATELPRSLPRTSHISGLASTVLLVHPSPLQFTQGSSSKTWHASLSFGADAIAAPYLEFLASLSLSNQYRTSSTSLHITFSAVNSTSSPCILVFQLRQRMALAIQRIKKLINPRLT